VAETFVIVTAGIGLSVWSVIALLGLIFVDLIVVQNVTWPITIVIVLLLGVILFQVLQNLMNLPGKPLSLDFAVKGSLVGWRR